MPSSKPKSSSRSTSGAQTLTSAQWRSAKKVPLGASFVMVKVGSAPAARVRPADQAAALVVKAAKALRAPGIARDSVFRVAAPKPIYAYSAAPDAPGLLVRESRDGTRAIGKIGADGRFRVLRKAA